MPATEMIEWTASAGRIHANGEIFHIKGANWFGTEGQHAMLYGLEKHGLDYYLEFLAANKFNSLRLRGRAAGSRHRRRRPNGSAAATTRATTTMRTTTMRRSSCLVRPKPTRTTCGARCAARARRASSS